MSTKARLNKLVSEIGTVAILDVDGQDQLRVVIEDAGAANVIEVSAKLTGQKDFVLLRELTGSVDEKVKISTYEQVKIECITVDPVGAAIKVIASSFKEASGSTIELDAPAGDSVTDVEVLTLTSSDNSVVITGNNTSKSIDLQVNLSSSLGDVQEYPSLLDFPPTGQSSILYVALDTGKLYRWSGSIYIEVSASPVTSVNTQTGAVVLTKSDIGLGQVDNTSDANKPISSATQTALNSKYDASNPAGYITAAQVPPSPVTSVNTQTGNVVLTKSDIGLGSVDNTSDADKPISTATQLALNAKQDSLGFTPENVTNKSTNTALGTSDSLYPSQKAVKVYVDNAVASGSAPDATTLSKGIVKLAGDLSGTADAPTVPALANKQDTLVSGTNIKSINGNSILGSGNLAISGGVTSVNSQTGDVTITKADIGLSNVDNTSDINKPISSATQLALNGKYDASNPSGYITAAQAPVISVNGLTGAVNIPTSSAISASEEGAQITAAVSSINFTGSTITASSDPSGNVTVNVTESGEASTLIVEAYNDTGSLIPKMAVVYINGSHGNLPKLALSQANAEMTSTKTVGIVRSDISHMDNGFVVATGRLENLDTDIIGWNEGDSLWLSPTIAGGIQNSKPIAPNHSVFVGTLIRKHPTQGVIEVKIQNGYELDELHNVLISSLSGGQVLRYDDSTSLWKNSTVVSDSITDGVADIAPSQNAVFDGLAGKADTNLDNLVDTSIPAGVRLTSLSTSQLQDSTEFAIATLEQTTSNSGNVKVRSGDVSSGTGLSSGAVRVVSGSNSNASGGAATTIVVGTINIASGNITGGTQGSTGGATLNSGSISGTSSYTGNTGGATIFSGNITNISTTGSTGIVTLTSGNNAGSGASGLASVKSGEASGNGASGNVSILSGKSMTQVSGSVNISSGSINTTIGTYFGQINNNTNTSATGSVSVSSGSISNNSSSATTGTVTISSGTNSGSGLSGATTLTSGNTTGTGSSGNVNVNSGTTTGANTGSVNVISGVPTGNFSSGSVFVRSGTTSGTAASGSTNITTGTTTGANTGSININTGVPSGNFSSGSVNIRSGNTSGTAGSGQFFIGSGDTTAATSGSVAIFTGNTTIGNVGSGVLTVYSGQTSGTVASGFAGFGSGSVSGAANSGNVQINSGGTTTQTSGSVTITTGSPSASVPSGGSGSAIFRSGDARGTGSSGLVQLQSGETGSLVNFSGASSGAVQIFSGNSTFGNFSSGNIQINSGSTAGTAASGSVDINSGNTAQATSGNITLRTGNPNTNFNSGNAELDTGFASGTGTSGNTTVRSGGTVNGDSGYVLLVSGSPSGSGNSGNVSIYSGNNSGTGNSGNINISTGTTTTGTRGGLLLGGAYTDITTGSLNLNTPNQTSRFTSNDFGTNVRGYFSVNNSTLTESVFINADGNGFPQVVVNSTNNVGNFPMVKAGTSKGTSAGGFGVQGSAVEGTVNGTFTAGSVNFESVSNSGYNDTAANLEINSGAVFLKTGNAFIKGTGVAANSGDVHIQTGSAAGSGFRGTVRVDSPFLSMQNNEIINTAAFYFGDPFTDGTYRIRPDGTNLVTERRESGVWVVKQTITP